MEVEKKVYSLKEAARSLGISYQTIVKIIASGDLNAINISEGKRGITSSELDRFIKSKENK